MTIITVFLILSFTDKIFMDIFIHAARMSNKVSKIDSQEYRDFYLKCSMMLMKISYKLWFTPNE